MTSRNAYLNLIRDAFPDLCFDQSKLITTGWDHDVVVLDDCIVFRFPKNEEYKARFPTELALLNEFAPRAPQSVPVYEYVAASGIFGGYRLIPGVECRPDLLKAFPIAAQNRMARDVAAFLTELHATPLAYARKSGVPEVSPSQQFWGPEQLKGVLARLREKVFPALPPDETEWVEEQFAAHFALSFKTRPALTHLDLTDDHILVDPVTQRLSGVIDFSDAEIADPARDFAGLWVYGEAFVGMVAENYGLEMSDDFLRRSKLSGLVVGLWHILEVAEGNPLPVSYDQSYQHFKAAMRSGLQV